MFTFADEEEDEEEKKRSKAFVGNAWFKKGSHWKGGYKSEETA